MTVKINTNPVAHAYTSAGTRIIEYTGKSGGGLISFREVGGNLVVDLYRHGATVSIRVAGTDHTGEDPPSINAFECVTWFLVRGESPTSRAVLPQLLGIDVPDEVESWAHETARAHGFSGFSADEPDLYLLVAPADETFRDVGGEVSHIQTWLPGSDATCIRRALEETD